ncbi:uncharacterized protein LOC127851898 isoform X2 [Dreissena polymorpha]|uniref:uncharacterized protein LOC127851898 isoform X2 n=1 Tax=Dreissena polymorpha TaxID=45954 RepID=UPI00226529F2|nr:uncharacterized protein LOC127851898 isoform X2 [Dreissena polymorpha]XP_052241815.1 uncharacterized protein LOC127851898 isoform X2 [Dreissena polymorpha]
MAEGGIDRTTSQTESVPGHSSLYSRHSQSIARGGKTGFSQRVFPGGGFFVPTLLLAASATFTNGRKQGRGTDLQFGNRLGRVERGEGCPLCGSWYQPSHHT